MRFVHEVLRRLRPGVPLRCLHGGMKQGKRLGVYQQFAGGAPGEGVVLLATDIAARGLDFPNVDWVVQVREAGKAGYMAHCVRACDSSLNA